jgi:hypothetical protein
VPNEKLPLAAPLTECGHRTARAAPSPIHRITEKANEMLSLITWQMEKDIIRDTFLDSVSERQTKALFETSTG